MATDVDDTEYDETHHKHHYQCKALDDVPFLEVYAQVIKKTFWSIVPSSMKRFPSLIMGT